MSGFGNSSPQCWVTDVQEDGKIEGKLAEQPYCHVVLREIRGFVEEAKGALELELQLELIRRSFAAKQNLMELSSLSSVMEKAGLTIKELEAAPDVDLETD